MHRLRRDGRVRIARKRSRTIYNILECGFYGSLCYAIIGPAVGLTAGFVGAGILAVLTASCIIFDRSRLTEVYGPIVVPLFCGVSFVALQVLIHNESLLNEYVRGFVTWLLMLIVTQSVSQRLEFLRRFALVALMIGLALLPFMRFSIDPTGPGRAELDRSLGLNNSNEFGAWFGFCAVYFLIVGIETRRTIVRAATWLTAAGCLYVVGLTVSRGALFAVTIAGLVAFRRLLRRGFAPVLVLVIFSGVIYNLGFFDPIVASYEARASQETGRMLIWPVAIERFLNSPLAGVGVSHMGTYFAEKQREITPHNGFLFIALAAGIIPVTCFISYWWHAGRCALSVSATELSVAPFVLPLFFYCLIVINTSNFPFMSACVLVTLSIVTTADDYSRMLRARRRQYPRSKRRFPPRLLVRQGCDSELQGSLARPPVK